MHSNHRELMHRAAHLQGSSQWVPKPTKFRTHREFVYGPSHQQGSSQWVPKPTTFGTHWELVYNHIRFTFYQGGS